MNRKRTEKLTEDNLPKKYVNDLPSQKPEKEPNTNEGAWIHPYIREIEKHCLDSDCSEYYFEKSFDLVNDEALLRAGVEICAVTEVEGDHVKNMIKFRRGGDESFVDCIHTTVCQFVLDPESEEGIEILSTEERPDLQLLLSPEEHYVAMKSFVGYLAEEGILNSLIASYETKFEQGQELLDFNHLMRQQLVRALVGVAPNASKDLLFLTLKRGSGGDIERIEAILSDIDEGGFTINDLSEDMVRFLVVASPTARLRIAWSKDDLAEDVIRRLAGDEVFKVRRAVASRYPLPEDVVRKLAEDEHVFVRKKCWQTRLAAARRNDLSEDEIRILARDVNRKVRLQIAEKKDLPRDVVERLSRDEDGQVRFEIHKRPDYVFRGMVKDLELGMRNLNLTLRVLEKRREYETFTGHWKTGDRVRHETAYFLVGDETGTIVLRVSDDDIGKVSENDLIQIEDGYVGLERRSPILRLMDSGRISPASKEGSCRD